MASWTTTATDLARRKVRIVAKVTPFDAELANGTHRITVSRPDGEFTEKAATIVVSDEASARSESFKFDWCYGMDEGVGHVFSKEVKPLLEGVLGGSNAAVLAYGARRSGKTSLIHGSEEMPGLARLSMEEIFGLRNEKEISVKISFYEIYQEHMYDLLEPKEQEVVVLEDAEGRIQLKGLSRVGVGSMADFTRLCANAQKAVNDVGVSRRHKGLIVYVSCCNNNKSGASRIGKINFVDLAGYEDIKQVSDGRGCYSESSRINISLYALHNVVYALNANENHVRYRDSKLTRVLRDSIGGGSRALMIACLRPMGCQDTIRILGLASRSCQDHNKHLHDSIKKQKDGARTITSCSSSVSRTKSVTCSSVKKSGISRFRSIEKKAKDAPSSARGRKFFDAQNPDVSSMQENNLPNDDKVVIPATLDEENYVFNVAVVQDSFVTEENAFSKEKDENAEDLDNGCSGKLSNDLEDAKTKMEEQKDLGDNGGVSSPPISARLREITNTLKSLCSPLPLCIKTPSDGISQSKDAILEPKTPAALFSKRVVDDQVHAECGTPLERYSARSAGLKNSLAKEYLKVLNSASKVQLNTIGKVQNKGIGEKRANYILELREESPEPFKEIEDLREIGLSSKQIKGIMRQMAGDLFN
ncbi:Kinesin-like calmodulin-binding protein [Acorus gramineus]|uniref:Kinesin-like calmodulin-binding protein n=1 Tax=Acorus gramineus TaxID=55184 RepID=A0AAV9AU31_ACOGR|nr:Kinesin-like calmodulin-binding protein [Acorus gramineus]